MSFLDTLLGRAKPKSVLDLLRARESLPVAQAHQVDSRLAGLPIPAVENLPAELAPPTESMLNPLLDRVKTDRRGFLDLLRQGAVAASVPGKARAAQSVLLNPLVRQLLEPPSQGAAARQPPLQILARYLRENHLPETSIDELVEVGGIKPSEAYRMIQQAQSPDVTGVLEHQRLLRGELSQGQLRDRLLRPLVEDNLMNQGGLGSRSLGEHYDGGNTDYGVYPGASLGDFSKKLMEHYGLTGPSSLPRQYEDLFRQAEALSAKRYIELGRGYTDRSGDSFVRWRLKGDRNWNVRDTEGMRPDKFEEYLLDDVASDRADEIMRQLGLGGQQP